LVRKIGDELKTKLGTVKGIHPSVQMLFSVLSIDKLEQPQAGTLSDVSRLAYTGKLLLEKNPDEAFKWATLPQPGTEDHQFKALVLCAEWSNDPGPAIDAALNIVNTTKGKPLVRLSQSHISRLA